MRERPNDDRSNRDQEQHDQAQHDCRCEDRVTSSAGRPEDCSFVQFSAFTEAAGHRGEKGVGSTLYLRLEFSIELGYTAGTFPDPFSWRQPVETLPNANVSMLADSCALCISLFRLRVEPFYDTSIARRLLSAQPASRCVAAA